jgi:hypothetical protein
MKVLEVFVSHLESVSASKTTTELIVKVAWVS